MALLSVLLVLAMGVWIEREALRQLERELNLKLQAVGEAAIQLVGPGITPALFRLQPGQETFAIHLDRRHALIGLRERTGVRRIFLADTLGNSYCDTDDRVRIGSPLPQMRSDRLQIRSVRQGQPASASLFRDDLGQPRKTAYVPVIHEGSVIGIMGVDADAAVLGSAQRLRLRILTVGGVGLVLALLLAAGVARGLSRPIQVLVAWAQRTGGGDLSSPVPATGGGEIAILGRTLEQMRSALEARDREQRAMVAGVAHEIRNPLGGIRLYTDLLRGDEAIQEGARQRLDKIVRELDHIGAIVEEFLTYARPAEPHPQIVALDEAAAELVEWLRPQAEGKGISLELVRVAPGPQPIQARLDPHHLRQMLQNLVQNAIQASPAGSRILVEVRSRSSAMDAGGPQPDPAAGRLDGRAPVGDALSTWPDALSDPLSMDGHAILVDDEGAGLDPQQRGRLFEPFYTTKAAGAGLGLAIVRRLALLNGGAVGVEEKGSPGARFVLKFPEA